MAQNHNENGLLIHISPSLLTGDGIAGTGWLAWVAWPMSMGDGDGIGIVFSFNCQRSWGRSPGIDSSTTSTNILHPSASLMPFQNHGVASCHFSHGYNKIDSKDIQFDKFDIYFYQYY